VTDGLLSVCMGFGSRAAHIRWSSLPGILGNESGHREDFKMETLVILLI